MNRARSIKQSVLIAALVLAGCGGGGSPSDGATDESAPSGPSGPASASPTAKPDLIIVGATLKPMQGQQFLSVTVKNIGQATVTGVNGACSYQCPIAGVSVTQSFLQDGYLVPGGLSYGLLPITPSCNPDVVVHFECVVDPKNEHAETNESNNGWSGDLKMR